MAKKYKVKSSSVGGINNKIYRSKEIVTAKCFATDVDVLVKQGFLVEIKPSGATESESSDINTSNDGNASDDIKSVSDFSKKEIVAFLKEQQIDFKESDNKETLWKLLLNLEVEDGSSIIDLLVESTMV